MAGIPDTRPKKGSLEGTRRGPASDEATRDRRQQAQPVQRTPVQVRGTRASARPSFQPNAGFNSPYAAWKRARMGMLALALFLVVIVLSAFLDSWFGALFVTIFLGFGFFRSDYRKNSGEWLSALDSFIAERLPAKFCPDCGQSIFDHSRPGQVADEGEALAFFPARSCANCGYDLTKPGNG